MDNNKYFEWIPVQDELPMDGERILVTRNGMPSIPELCVWNEYYDVFDDSEGDDFAFNKEDIDCWMRIKTIDIK